VRFVELPLEEWHTLSNEEKRRHGISKNAGVSVLRAGREIDYGWYFMGGKRKENYDDWWRCEVEFQPDLDDLFGVTHTKQGINPTDQIAGLLTPDLEQIAHKLNSNVRRRFISIKPTLTASSEHHAAERDAQCEPPRNVFASRPGASGRVGTPKAVSYPVSSFALEGVRYKLLVKDLPSGDFFTSQLEGSHLTVALNGLHPFFERIYQPLVNGGELDAIALRRGIELVVLAVARAEAGLESHESRAAFQQFRSSWNNLLAVFLT
jgi:hypothetical protein